ncbi:hypothetical protein P4114_06145 [Pseudomonas aeruginosa]|nr:hypothetical protein [Pseudomonas aeruginosa]
MSTHEDLLLQLIQREPDKIRSILGLPAPKPDLSWYEGAEVWIEAGHRSDRAAELRIAFGEPLPHGYADFWIPFSGPDGNALGWLRFSYITTVREKPMFTACEWRSASELAPAKRAVWICLWTGCRKVSLPSPATVRPDVPISSQ